MTGEVSLNSVVQFLCFFQTRYQVYFGYSCSLNALMGSQYGCCWKSSVSNAVMGELDCAGQ